MTGILLLISFLLHIITLTAVFQLLKKVKQEKQNNINEITELFEIYLREIREENRYLENKLAEINKSDNLIATNTSKNMLDDEEEITMQEHVIQANKVNDRSETSLQAKILQLYNQGLSHEEIASKLNCGKTEAELIIKLHARPNNA